MDREKVIAWLTEISLRPCDFATDDFDAYETEHLANEALEICEDAKVFNQQRNDAIALLKEQEETIRNREQEIRDKNERLKERAEQVDSMLKEKETVEPICIKKDFVDEFYGYVASCPKCKTLWIMYQDEKMHYCPNCGRSVKWE